MLKGIHPLLDPQLLHALASMGHGDSIAVVDNNFPAASVANELVVKTPLTMSVSATDALEAILSVLPIDQFEPDDAPVLGMQIVGEPNTIPEVVQAASSLFETAGATVTLIERFAFYKAAKNAFALVHTAETRFYGNFIIRKGVV